MNIYQTIFNISILVWIFPAIRQFKNKYFLYFLTLAMSDIIIKILRTVFESQSNLSIILLNCLMILSLVAKEKIKQTLFWIVPFYIIVFILALYLNDRYFETYVSMFLTIIIFYIFIKDFFNYTIVHQEINIFLFMLTFYQALNIFKKINILAMVYEGAFFYFMTAAFQLLIGIFFSLYSFNNTKLNIKITSKEKT